jgi:DNA-binding ferritin-like protein
MTEEQMNQLASKIVDMIFERQAAIDEEYLKEWQAEILRQELAPDQDELIQQLKSRLKDAEARGDYDECARIHQVLKNLE